jgi:hypothetical protein
MRVKWLYCGDLILEIRSNHEGENSTDYLETFDSFKDPTSVNAFVSSSGPGLTLSSTKDHHVLLVTYGRCFPAVLAGPSRSRVHLHTSPLQDPVCEMFSDATHPPTAFRSFLAKLY